MTAPTWRVLSVWPYPKEDTRPSGFRTTWPASLDKLEAEIGRHKGTDVVISVVTTPDAVSWSGQLKPRWQPLHNGVEVSFALPDGNRYAMHSGRHRSVHENLHAITLTLEAMRAVERYGVATGQQWQGFLALPEDTTIERGRTLVLAAGGVREALKAHHPDAGGKTEDAAAINAYAATVKP